MKQKLMNVYLHVDSIMGHKIFKVYLRNLLIFLLMLIFLYILIFYAFLKDSYFVRLGDTDYEVGWVNSPDQTSVFYTPAPDKGGESLVEGRVTDIYWNDKYILVKKCQHYNDSVDGYFIIKILPKNNKWPQYKKTGPYTEKEYTQMKLKLHLEEKQMKYENIFKRWIWL